MPDFSLSPAISWLSANEFVRSNTGIGAGSGALVTNVSIGQ